MVQLLQVVVYRYMGADRNPVRLASATDLSSFSFFVRRQVGEHLRFATRTICQRTLPGQRQSIVLADLPYFCHIYSRHDGLSVCVITDKEYNLRVAFSFITKTMMDFEKLNPKWGTIIIDQEIEPPELVRDFKLYQEPQQADKIMQVQKNLDEIKDIMHKNIDDVLKRGETIDSLMDKSQDLSNVSLQFYRKARKTNQCCKSY